MLRAVPDPSPEPIPSLDGVSINEDIAAQFFARRFTGTFAYCNARKKWFEFDGSIWRVQTLNETEHQLRLLSRELASTNAATANKICTAKFIRAVETLCHADPIFVRNANDWNRNPMLLGTPGGTVDLKTGILRKSKQAEGITRAVSVTPDEFEDCRTWFRFLNDATGGDKEIIRFLKQIAGYCLTGLTTEQALFFIYGTGGNGKGVFMRAIQGILGDYAVTANMEMLERQRGSRHATEIVALMGARAVFASEVDKGASWNEKRLKQMTGGDKLKGNFMRQDEIEFDPEFKIIISGNDQPALENVDEAMRRRFNIIPFMRTPTVVDGQLDDKIKREWPGILRWAIEGCLGWQKNGLVRPMAVLQATAEYFSDQDSLGQWIEQECRLELDNQFLTCRSSELFASWSRFAIASGLKPGTTKTFKPALRQVGIFEDRTKFGVFYKGVDLKRQVHDSEL